MHLNIDKQTLNDLAIFQNGDQRRSVFGLFSDTKTIGGREALVTIFNKPLAHPDQIKERIAVFKYIKDHDLTISLDKNSYDLAEFYLRKHYETKAFPLLTGFIEKIIYTFNNNHEYYLIQRGVETVLTILGNLIKYAEALHGDLPKKLTEFRSVILDTIPADEFNWLKQLIAKPKPGAVDIAKADHLLRHVAYEKIKAILNVAYQLDVYQSVSLCGKALDFTFPVIRENTGPCLSIEGLFHPFISDPESNDIAFGENKNVCFVTGTNMAGKSSLLKSVGISIYLSQLGFPVPAKYMETSTFKGLISTINLADDVEQGHSHFYKEVLRVKRVAQQLSSSTGVFVIFDELFKGTNVKDAYDASLAIISAFARVNSCFFMVSTHIVEVAHELSTIENINFRYMETIFEGANPVNTYKLKPGITEERLGMWIVKNEGILEIIEKAVKGLS